MKELEIKYEITFTCDEWLIEYINREWEIALSETIGTEAEEEIFKIALGYALSNNYGMSHNELDAICQQSHTIYKWWKENKENE